MRFPGSIVEAFGRGPAKLSMRFDHESSLMLMVAALPLSWPSRYGHIADALQDFVGKLGERASLTVRQSRSVTLSVGPTASIVKSTPRHFRWAVPYSMRLLGYHVRPGHVVVDKILSSSGTGVVICVTKRS